MVRESKTRKAAEKREWYMVRAWLMGHQPIGLTEGENEDKAKMARGRGNSPALRGLSGLVRPE